MTPPNTEQLTVAQLIQDLQVMPPETEITVAIAGVGMTIPITQLMKIQADDNKELAVIVIHATGTQRAFEYARDQYEQSAGIVN